MKSNKVQMTWVLCFAIVMASCTPSDLIRPGNKIGPMWVQRYGHTNADWIGNYCDMDITDTPGVQTVECTVPKVDELWIGSGSCGVDEEQRDVIFRQARTWEMYIDGYEVDLPAFNTADFKYEELYCLDWRIRLREIPPGEHTIRYVMNVNQEVEGEPDPLPLGTYELIINFLQEE
jgi:hypothetical protein